MGNVSNVSSQMPSMTRGSVIEATVKSHTVPGTEYQVRQDAWGNWWCSCPGFTYSKGCKHVRSMRFGGSPGGQPIYYEQCNGRGKDGSECYGIWGHCEFHD